jgi:diacylglycerol diphosphate phosphatase/phosphatidate phosphatase
VDWLLVIAFIIAFNAIDAVNGHQREFSLTDQSIMYTFAVHERVPTWLLVVLAVIAPIVIVVVWTLVIPPIGSIQRRRWRKGGVTIREKLWDANLSLLGIGLAIASTITVTNSFKNLVGRPRPGIPMRRRES